MAKLAEFMEKLKAKAERVTDKLWEASQTGVFEGGSGFGVYFVLVDAEGQG